jgi:hypothetical protein
VIAPAVKTATALDPYVVRVVFADGEVRDVDIEPLLDGPVFQALREPSMFARVTVDEYGETIVWPNGADLDPDVIYAIAEPASAPGPRVSIPIAPERPLADYDLFLSGVTAEVTVSCLSPSGARLRLG